ncbi:nucleotide sugar dehydrogenase [Streptomyces silvisoli]|uniref:Nucleotide sugar dehydrogenase n=1 Tax=Streptomyces silvisoli TaxID=3034235 RepID=A0ABT5ZS55_9ACTN|nr:nucleotide sugar dehydrogenase [Streptomyces silvisoli]MDF3292655.1 nucleotide sugar dehydrogenase [Streptomyces silvisoli]
MVTERHTDDGYTAVIGLGYVGLPLAAALATAGSRVVGIDNDPTVRAAIQAGAPLFREPGLPELLADTVDRFSVVDALPDARPGAVIVCVGTPPEPKTHQANLAHLRAAVDMFAHLVDENCPVIIRSTVPVGTCRDVVLPRLTAHQPAPLLAFCPERTIQGTALAEIRSLPQIIGGLDERSTAAARQLLAPVMPDQITVSSMEAAEMAKLVCNAHTDVIYGFGNEVAMIAEGLGLDANEVIASANLRYPRPDISRPGFVGGSCLVKDPYMLLAAARRAGHQADMVASARALNERVPEHAVHRVLRALAARGRDLAEATVMICGIAYKGTPETDDVRGSAATPTQAILAGRVARLIGHDFVVGDDRIAAMGFEPSELADGLSKADAVLLLSDHPGYDRPDVAGLLASSPVVFDMWGMWQHSLASTAGVEYLRLGRG